jgi:putative ABC transport system permease protein
MEELFGISMTYIAGGCIAATVGIFGFVALLAWRNPVMFKNGLRNIPRRTAQTALIVVGLMLSTVIITAAFGTGDTMTHSITSEVFTMLGPVDEFIQWDTTLHPAAEEKQLIPLSEVQKWQDQFKNDPDIHGFLPSVREVMPLYNQRTRLNFAFPSMVSSPTADLDRVWGGLKDVNGKRIDLATNEIAVNKALADKTDTKPGDTVTIHYQDKPYDLIVKAVLPNTMASGAGDTITREGAALNYDFLTGLTGRQGMANVVGVSIDGTTRGASADRRRWRRSSRLPWRERTSRSPKPRAMPSGWPSYTGTSSRPCSS